VAVTRPLELRPGLPWDDGECFKCERSDVPVTPIGVLEGSSGAVELFSCYGCTFRLETYLHGTLSGTYQAPRLPLNPRSGHVFPHRGPERASSPPPQP
jgi:hypothetical protein